MTAVAFLVVAAVATLARAWLTGNQERAVIPWRTFAVNVSGAFVLGLFFGLQFTNEPIIATTAGLGSLTTFSTIAAETAALLDDGKRSTAVVYVALSIVVGIAAAWLGLTLGEAL